MDEQMPERVPGVSTDMTTKTNLNEPVVTRSASVTQPKNDKPRTPWIYIGVVAAILLIFGGLLFVLEKEERISTGLFENMSEENRTPAIKVNDETISQAEFNSSLEQLNEMSAAQGVDLNDPIIAAQLKDQAIETLINAELLRQAALQAGITVSDEEIDGRYTEIKEQIGGEEALQARMEEFEVTEASLRKDIENEFLIQGLLEAKIDTESITVSEEEKSALYEEAGGEAAGLPPFTEVEEQIDAQIRFNKEQELINAYIEQLRAEAEVEILI